MPTLSGDATAEEKAALVKKLNDLANSTVEADKALAELAEKVEYINSTQGEKNTTVAGLFDQKSQAIKDAANMQGEANLIAASGGMTRAQIEAQMAQQQAQISARQTTNSCPARN